MAKSSSLFILSMIVASCVNMKPAPQQTPPPETNNYYEDTGYREWGGPGWYWGIYINNQNDYWHHYDRHHHGHDRHHHPNRRSDRGGRHGHGGRHH
jgi:hypothetical protein